MGEALLIRLNWGWKVPTGKERLIRENFHISTHEFPSIYRGLLRTSRALHPSSFGKPLVLFPYSILLPARTQQQRQLLSAPPRAVSMGYIFSSLVFQKVYFLQLVWPHFLHEQRRDPRPRVEGSRGILLGTRTENCYTKRSEHAGEDWHFLYPTPCVLFS